MSFQIIICLFAVLTTEIFGKDVRILGGKNTDIRAFPFTASIRDVSQNLIICSGAIISNKHILTAAHCLYQEEHHYDKIKIYTGITITQSTTGGVHEIQHVYCHPEFTGSITVEAMNRHDIAVVEVKEVIHFNEFQNLITLPNSDIANFETGWIVGWGSITYPLDTPPEQLQKAVMRIFPNRFCMQSYPLQIHPDQLCAFDNVGIGPCVGDSGGPLVIVNNIVGIVSVNFPCAQGLPDIYTRVYSYMDFIRSIIGT